MTPPKVYIGSSTWCDKTPKEVVEKYIPVLQELGVKEIDTAPIYPVLSPGETEKLLGELGFVSNGFLVDSKVLYFGDGSGTLTADAIQRSLDSSLANIKTGKVRELINKVTRTLAKTAHSSTFYIATAQTKQPPSQTKPLQWTPNTARVNSPNSALAIFHPPCSKNGFRSHQNKVTSNRAFSRGNTTFFAVPPSLLSSLYCGNTISPS